MAGHEERNRVGAHGGASGSTRARHPGDCSKSAVTDGLTAAKLPKSSPEGELKRCAREAQGNGEGSAASAEVPLQLRAGAVEQPVRSFGSAVVGEQPIGLDLKRGNGIAVGQQFDAADRARHADEERGGGVRKSHDRNRNAASAAVPAGVHHAANTELRARLWRGGTRCDAPALTGYRGGMTNTEHRNLGTSGLRVSTIGLGCNNFGRAGTVTETQDGTNAVIHAAIDAGVTLFDGADLYGAQRGQSETLMGKALKGKRDQIVLATKFGMDMDGTNGPDWGARGSRRYVRLAVEASLRRLKTDWIDLYQLHAPDPHTPIAETLSVLDDLVREGKVRYLGHSNLAGWQIAEAHLTAELGGFEHFVSAQNEYNLMSRGAEREVLPAVRHFGLGFLPYYPLHNGILTGKYTREGGPKDARVTKLKPQLMEHVDWDRMDRFQAFCDERGIPMLHATFGWLLAQPNLTSVIAGATTAEQVQQNAEAATAWEPSDDDLAKIESIFG